MRSRLAALLLGSLLAFLSGELLGRALGPGPRPSGPPSVNWAAWVLDPVTGFANRPHLEFPNHAIRGRPLVRTDADGLRRGGPAGPARLLVVGDSTSFGAEVADQETLPARLGAALGMPVANAAVRGYSSVQAWRSLERELARRPSLEAALYVLTTNDLEENLTPAAPAPAPRLVPAGDGFRVQEPALPAAPGTAVAAGRDPGVRWWLRTRCAVVDLAIDAGRVLGEWRREPGAGVAPATASRSLPRDLREPASRSGSAPRDLREPALAWVLARMVAACRGARVPLLVTVFPGTPPEVQAALVPRAGGFRQLVEEAGGVFLALPPDFPYLDSSLRARRPWIGRDPHFGAQGTRRWAAALLPSLQVALGR